MSKRRSLRTGMKSPVADATVQSIKKNRGFPGQRVNYQPGRYIGCWHVNSAYLCSEVNGDEHVKLDFEGNTDRRGSRGKLVRNKRLAAIWDYANCSGFAAHRIHRGNFSLLAGALLRHAEPRS